jgi:hypothetical protein
VDYEGWGDGGGCVGFDFDVPIGTVCEVFGFEEAGCDDLSCVGIR